MTSRVVAPPVCSKVGGFGSPAFLSPKDLALMLACVHAYNDFLIDWIALDPRRFIPVVAALFWDVEACR